MIDQEVEIALQHSGWPGWESLTRQAAGPVPRHCPGRAASAMGSLADADLDADGDEDAGAGRSCVLVPSLSPGSIADPRVPPTPLVTPPVAF